MTQAPILSRQPTERPNSKGFGSCFVYNIPQSAKLLPWNVYIPRLIQFLADLKKARGRNSMLLPFYIHFRLTIMNIRLIYVYSTVYNATFLICHIIHQSFRHSDNRHSSYLTTVLPATSPRLTFRPSQPAVRSGSPATGHSLARPAVFCSPAADAR